MKTSGIAAVILGLLMLSSTGCALVDMKLPLSYKPAGQPSLGHGAVEIAQPPDPQFKKNREGLPIIGNVRNGYGMHTADVVAKDSIPRWFANSTAAQLSEAGYQTVVVDRLSPTCQRGIEIDIRRIMTDMDPGMFSIGGVSQIECVMTVTKNGEPVEQIRFESMADDRGIVGGGGELEKGLEKAMQLWLAQATRYAAAAWKE